MLSKRDVQHVKNSKAFVGNELFIEMRFLWHRKLRSSIIFNSLSPMYINLNEAPLPKVRKPGTDEIS